MREAVKLCGPCEKYRKDLGEAMSRGAFIKAARVAMEAAAYAATGKKEGKDAKSSAKTGE